MMMVRILFQVTVEVEAAIHMGILIDWNSFREPNLDGILKNTGKGQTLIMESKLMKE